MTSWSQLTAHELDGAAALLVVDRHAASADARLVPEGGSHCYGARRDGNAASADASLVPEGGSHCYEAGRDGNEASADASPVPE